MYTSLFGANVFVCTLLFPLSVALPTIYGEKDWSYFVFAQEWPPAACLEVPGGKCKIPKNVVDWSIHGMWPTSDKGYPSFCNSSWHFNPDILKPILIPLEQKWPNIYADSTENSFWKHEWVKHGTCATSLESFDSEYKYFKESLLLHDKLDVHEFLRKAGILPSADNPQTLKYIENAIQSHTNTTVKLFCKNHEQYSSPVLTSMYICMDKNLKLIDCDKIDEPPCKKPDVFYLPFDRKNNTKNYNF